MVVIIINSIDKLDIIFSYPYSIEVVELNVCGEICCLSQEEEGPELSDWQLQQTAKAQKIVMIHPIEIVAILN